MNKITDFKKFADDDIFYNTICGGGASYDNFKTNETDGFVFFKRKALYDRVKIAKTLRGCAQGNVYNVKFTCKISENSPLEKAKILVGYMGIDDTKSECEHEFEITKEKKEFAFTYNVKNAEKSFIAFEQSGNDENVLESFSVEKTETNLLSGTEDFSNADFKIKIDREGKTVIHLIGDSIVCDYPDANQIRGWGMYIGEYFDSEKIKVNNMAKGGYSTKTFLKCLAGLCRLRCVCDNMQKGDCLIISLGINDSSKDKWAGVDICDYKKYLEKMADEAVKRGATVIFVTPTVTLEENKLRNIRRDRAEAMKEVAEKVKGAYLLDLNKLMFSESEKKIAEMGFDAFWLKYFGATQDDGTRDITHHCQTGSKWVLSLIMTLLSETDCALNNFRKK